MRITFKVNAARIELPSQRKESAILNSPRGTKASSIGRRTAPSLCQNYKPAARKLPENQSLNDTIFKKVDVRWESDREATIRRVRQKIQESFGFHTVIPCFHEFHVEIAGSY